MAHWLLTWTTYGTWLPGDRRGFVSGVKQPDGTRLEQNQPGTPYAANLPALHTYASGLMKGEPVWLTPQQTGILLDQFRETARVRGYNLLGLAIMANHVHLVVEVAEGTRAALLLRDFKGYGSRALNRDGNTQQKHWWTVSGSVRMLPVENAVMHAVKYVRNQKNPLLVWTENL